MLKSIEVPGAVLGKSLGAGETPSINVVAEAPNPTVVRTDEASSAFLNEFTARVSSLYTVSKTYDRKA
jgi:hypothetical protein